MILVAYDGSADAQAAIDRAAQLMPGARTTVLCVWDMYAFAGSAYAFDASEDIVAVSHEAALATAGEGARRATAAGLIASPHADSRDGDVARTILAVADDIDAGVVITGTRGLSGAKAFVLGSVSHTVLQHAKQPVLVVPSPALIERRHDRDHRVALSA